MTEEKLAELLRDAIEASNISGHLKLEGMPESEGEVLLEAVLKLQEPELSLNLVRKAAKGNDTMRTITYDRADPESVRGAILDLLAVANTLGMKVICSVPANTVDSTTPNAPLSSFLRRPGESEGEAEKRITGE